MDPNMTMANESFDFLSHSSDFLNIVLNNIQSCVLLLDKNVELRAYNNSLKTIFSNRKDEDLLYVRCGEALGCAFQIEEQLECGKTSHCKSCELRVSALMSYINNEAIYKDHIVKPFLTFENKRVDKHLQFSTRLFYFGKEKYIILLIDDITKWFKPQNE